MNISIASVDYDLAGHITIDVSPITTDGDTARRVSRVATLDGDVAIIDRGYAEGDRTLEYTWRPTSKTEIDTIDRLFKQYSLLNVSTHNAVYLAAPNRFTPGAEEATMTLYVKSVLSE